MNGLSEEVISSFNKLVYEYLVKMKFEKSAAVFKSESRLGDVRMSDTSPALLNWYNIFIETADVRSGKTYIPENLNRIEGIMLKLENDKQRYAKMNALSLQHRKSPATPGQGYYEAGERPGNGYEKSFGMDKSGSYEKLIGFDKPLGFDQPGAYEKGAGRARGLSYAQDFASQKMPNMQYQNHPAPCHSQLKEYQRIELNIPLIIISRYCPVSRLIINCCVDGKVYFYSLPQNTIKYSFQLPRRQIKQIKLAELHDGLFFAFSFDETAIYLCKYINCQKEDIKTIELDIAVRSYCFGNNSIFVLTENSTLRIYSLGGELLRTFKISSAVSIVEFFGNNLLFTESSRVVEFDININMEIKTLGRGKHPAVCVKEDFAFVVFPDSIQVFGLKSQFPIVTLKSTLDCRDLAFVSNKVAICTGTDVYCGSDVLQIPNSISVSSFTLPNVSGLMTVTADGLLLLFKSNSINEYI